MLKDHIRKSNFTFLETNKAPKNKKQYQQKLWELFFFFGSMIFIILAV